MSNNDLPLIILQNRKVIEEESLLSRNMISSTDLAYCAGLFDGEGCISINAIKHKDYKRLGFQLRASICMTNQLAIERMQLFFGGTFTDAPRKRGKHTYQWVVAANKAVPVIEALRPFLIVKAPQAMLALEFQNNRSTNKSDANWEREYQIYLQMQKLNKRWTEDDNS